MVYTYKMHIIYRIRLGPMPKALRVQCWCKLKVAQTSGFETNQDKKTEIFSPTPPPPARLGQSSIHRKRNLEAKQCRLFTWPLRTTKIDVDPCTTLLDH